MYIKFKIKILPYLTLIRMPCRNVCVTDELDVVLNECDVVSHAVQQCLRDR